MYNTTPGFPQIFQICCLLHLQIDGGPLSFLLQKLKEWLNDDRFMCDPYTSKANSFTAYDSMRFSIFMVVQTPHLFL